MARLASVEKLGYYPAAPAAVEALARHLAPPDGGKAVVLDPCAGEGRALATLCAALGVPGAGCYAIELDAARAEACRANLPGGATVLGPASFKATRITYNSFSFAYVNSPFDDELGGGGREEEAFAWSAGNLLAPGGVLALVMPLGTWQRQTDLRRHLESHYEDSEAFAFPPEHRPYNELAFIGRRRRAPLPREECDGRWAAYWKHRGYGGLDESWPVLGTGGRRWALPPGRAPRLFEKIDYTEAELVGALNASPLYRLLEPPPPRPRPAPPLSLGQGHIALLLASGHLDGLVRPEGGRPHVVRGSARKEKHLAEDMTTTDEDGNETHKQVWAERTQLVVRAVDSSGVIRTWEQ